MRWQYQQISRVIYSRRKIPPYSLLDSPFLSKGDDFFSRIADLD